jgi:hypothetical protein
LFRAPLIIFLCSLLCISSYGQKKYKTNLEIFDDIISSGLEKYFYYPDLNRNNQFVFIIKPGNFVNTEEAEKQQSRYLTALIKKKANEMGLRFGFADDENKLVKDSVYNLFVLSPVTMQTKYNGFKKNKFLGEKTINRSINIKISVDLRSSDNNFKDTGFIENSFSDEVNLDDFENIESTQYSFTQDTPPEIGQFESIVFPSILITVSAAATLLFFIIRTK